MGWTRNLNFDGSHGPTWKLVAMIALALACEVLEDVVSGSAGCARGFDYNACWSFCEGRPSGVGVEGCSCYPRTP